MTSRAAVRATFETIAEEFAESRSHPWPEVEAFLEERADGDAGVALDVGCGNGRHAALLGLAADRVVGVDASRRLLELADLEAVAGDAARLPVATGVADLAVYVATLHHLPTRADRVASLDELARALAPGGEGLVSAWSTAHEQFDREEGFDTTVGWTTDDGTTVERFYHIYDPAEFRRDIVDSDLDPLWVGVSSGNCYAAVRPEEKRP